MVLHVMEEMVRILHNNAHTSTASTVLLQRRRIWRYANREVDGLMGACLAAMQRWSNQCMDLLYSSHV